MNNKITEILAFVGRCYRPSVTMGYKLPKLWFLIIFLKSLQTNV